MTVIHEYGSVDLDLTRGQAEALQRTGYVEVVPRAGGQWRVTAGSYVGSIVADDVELLIRPKIDPENLFLLLEPGLPPSAWRDEAFRYDATSRLLPSIVAFFARTVETTLGRGVLRSYRRHEGSLVAIRGRIDVTTQFRRAGMLTPLACSYDEFTEDVPENQILRAAIRLALRVPQVDLVERQRLMRQLVALESVTDVPVRADMVDTVVFTRLNRHYAPALRLARLLLENMTLSDTTGRHSASSFVVDMNDLFQRFVTERLRRELRGRLEVSDEPTVHLGVGRQVSMQPDLVFHTPGTGPSYVADIKYKLASDARGTSDDYYQLLAYTTAMNLPEGMLIYCRRQGDLRTRAVTVRNAGKRLVVQSIDLTGSPAQVEEEIAALAEAIRVGAASSSRHSSRIRA